MTRTYKPAALHLIWNADLTITIKARGKKLHRTRVAYAYEDAKSFITGWFGDNAHNIRWTFVRSKKVAA